MRLLVIESSAKERKKERKKESSMKRMIAQHNQEKMY